MTRQRICCISIKHLPKGPSQRTFVSELPWHEYLFHTLLSYFAVSFATGSLTEIKIGLVVSYTAA